jgi:NADPH:quinone reductase-like Zn-dependent oxidoreductase
LPAALARTKANGLLLWFGQASRTSVTLNFFSFFAGPNEATIRHFDYTKSDRTDGEDLATLVYLVDTGRLHPEIGLSLDWGHTAEVLANLRARHVRGNAVLTLA